MKLNRIAAALLLLAASVPAHAEIDQPADAYARQEFRALSEDLGSALSYKPLQPTAPLGVPGFDIGVAVTGTKLKHPGSLPARHAATRLPDDASVVPSVRAEPGPAARTSM